MIADKLISLLDGVTETGRDRWIACCPSHEDRSPSLAIREAEDSLLIYCHAGCSSYEIVSAVGLELSDLYPEKLSVVGNRPMSKPFPAADVLKCLSQESIYLSIIAEAIGKGEKLETYEVDRVFTSASRFNSALEACGL